jgi:hypothetical protein
VTAAIWAGGANAINLRTLAGCAWQHPPPSTGLCVATSALSVLPGLSAMRPGRQITLDLNKKPGWSPPSDPAGRGSGTQPRRGDCRGRFGVLLGRPR